MNCDDVRGLEAEIVLGMLDSLTETEVMLHLDSCTDHPQLAGYRAALLALDLSLAPIQPSSELNERIAATVRTRRSNTRSRPAWLITIAAALLIGLMVSSIWVIRGEDTSLNRTFETASGVQVDVHAESGRAELRLSLANLDTSSTDTFTAWAIRDGRWLLIGDFSASSAGRWQGTFAFELQPGDALCVTVGATPTEDAPRGDTLFVEPL